MVSRLGVAGLSPGHKNLWKQSRECVDPADCAGSMVRNRQKSVILVGHISDRFAVASAGLSGIVSWLGSRGMENLVT